MITTQQADQLTDTLRSIDDATARLEALFCVCIDSGEEVTKGHIATFLRMINEDLTKQLRILYQMAYDAKNNASSSSL